MNYNEVQVKYELILCKCVGAMKAGIFTCLVYCFIPRAKSTTLLVIEAQ